MKKFNLFLLSLSFFVFSIFNAKLQAQDWAYHNIGPSATWYDKVESTTNYKLA